MRTLLAALTAFGLLAATAHAQGTATETPAAPSARAALLDLNSATKAELDALPGIGEVRAEAIINGRPYGGKDDLVSRNIVPQGVYDAIKDRIVARQKS